MGTAYTSAVGSAPDPRTYEFLSWASNLVNYRLNECPLERTTTYYIKQDAGGNNTGGSGDGSESTPWLVSDWDDAATLINAQMAANTRFRLNRGDLFRGSGQVTVDEANVTIDAYGSGDKPYITHFTETVASGGGTWTLDSGTTYYITGVSTQVVGIRRQDDRLYTRFNPMCYVTSTGDLTASVDQTYGNWFWDSGTSRLYIDIGEDPNSYDWEYAEIDATNSSAILFSDVDGLRGDSLIADGWGLDPTSTNGTQRHGFKSFCRGTNTHLWTYCESYFGSTHTFAFNGGGNPSTDEGGIATFYKCKSGWTTSTGPSTTVFNSYVARGQQETIFDSCEVVAGGVPIGTTPETTRGSHKGFYSHTSVGGGSFVAGLLITRNCTSNGSYWVGSDISYNDLPDTSGGGITASRGFVIGMTGTWRTGSQLAGTYAVKVNCNQIFDLYDTVVQSMYNAAGQTLAGWAFNNVFTFDLTDITSSLFAAWNPNTATSSVYWHNRFHVIGNGNTTRWRFTYDGTSLGDDDIWKNNIFTATNMGTRGAYLNEGNNLVNASNIDNNAYFGWSGDSDTTTDAGYGNDANKIELSSSPPLTASPNSSSSLHNQGTDLSIEYDIYGRKRTGSTPTIGPIEVPTVAAASAGPSATSTMPSSVSTSIK